MSTERLSPERTQAHHKFREAEQQAAKHHYELALGSARDALELDPTYCEVRHWIVDLYLKIDQPRKAALVLQEILHENSEDEQAWAKLHEVDPAAAERLERLHSIAPDPFVVQRTADNPISDDLDDLSGFNDEFAPEVEELVPSAEGPAELDSLEDLAGTDAIEPLLGDEVDAASQGAGASSAGSRAGQFDELDMSGEDEDEQTAEEPALPQPTAAVAAPAAPAPAPIPTPAVDLKSTAWMYEEDLKYRAKMDANPVYSKLLPEVIEFWQDDDSWETAFKASVHLDEHRHPEMAQVTREVETLVGAPKWTLFVCPERRMICTITRGVPQTLSLTTGVMNALSHAEQTFLLGRYTATVMVGHVPYLQMVALTLERTPRTITDVEMDLLELLKEHHAGWDAGVHREERIKLGALCHAWQQRAELTADRGGLLCCRDLDVACDAIAKSVAPDAASAQTVSWQSLLEKHKGDDPAQLAAIPPKEDPLRDEGYGVYRIQMLRWWAKTQAAKALLGG